MNIAQQETEASWSIDNSHMVLGNIFDGTKSIAIWSRHASTSLTQQTANNSQFALQKRISKYFELSFEHLGRGINGVFHIETLKQKLTTLLPNTDGRGQAVDDIYLLSDMLTCLFDCSSVGLRLVPLTSAMCPKFHVDNVPVRLVTTYNGMGTDWLPLEKLDNFAIKERGEFTPLLDTDIQHLNTFDVALLKGKAWEGHEHLAAIHRSCAVQRGQRRVLLSLDPM